jgi:hypothetical protein
VTPLMCQFATMLSCNDGDATTVTIALKKGDNFQKIDGSEQHKFSLSEFLKLQRKKSWVR